jgi:preprotein translocase subunit SecF
MNWLKYKRVYFAVSGLMIAAGVFALVSRGVNLGVEFTGGSVIEYEINGEFSTEEATRKLQEEQIEVNSIQTTAQDTYLFRFPPLNEDEKERVASVSAEFSQGDIKQLRFESVGPSVGPELVKKTVYATAIAAGGILLWVAYQFKSFKFGASAILAMLHDSFILIGSFSILGHFLQAEVDFLFITALLTTLSFSVHDTIVVFDRIREIADKEGGDLREVANRALTETMVRSLNNSFTIAFMLVALLLLGGTTIKWFAAALLIGTLLGTYSSPFVAVPLLVSWDGVVGKIKKLRGSILKR